MSALLPEWAGRGRRPGGGGPPLRGELRQRLARFSPRGLLLYLLPLPLVPAIAISLLRGEYPRVAGSAAALALLLGGAALARRGLRAEAHYRRRRVARPPPPRKTAAALLLSAGSAVLAAFSIGHPAPIAAGFAVATFVGFALAYGLDPRRAKRVVGSDGVTTEEVVEAIEEAEAAIARIEAAAARLPGGELAERLDHITGLAHEVVDLVEEDPRDLQRARRFLKVYLKGARQVCEDYARTGRRRPSREIDERFRRVLGSIEEVFAEQRDRLLESDVTDLDVRIEVLEQQLRREGIS